MKKLLGLTAIVLLFSITISAQGKQSGGANRGSDLTIEQRVTLQTKRMALNLDLDAKQQKEVEQMLLKSANENDKMRDEFRQKRQSGELTADEKFAFENSRIERQAAHKAEMKRILNKDQYAKWEKTLMNNRGKSGMRSNSNNPQKQFKNRG
ncbi:hypothetical protein [Lutibacter maritimus]|uniref:LTXXQ motif family protein n=1 Tax=Lutibacter maritimus TaxID=593133 RepID=A0A1I6R428_9FLAO|nr:hypothetical protein [Lutibacter maritimus]SFS59443.1 hypothetical protein SAMN04488006_2167 [Lutibacter maritimus]